MISNMEIIVRLILAAIIGGAIGIEREVSNRPAGLRTHILVSVGSALITLVSIYAFPSSADPARVAAQVVSGIGFLGAGTILRTGDNITGLTTAASLWVCAGIGLAIGGGYYLGGLVTAVIVLISLMALANVEKKYLKNMFKALEISGYERPGLIGDIGTIFGRFLITIKDIKIDEVNLEEDTYNYKIRFTIKLPVNIEINKLINALYSIKGVVKIAFDGNIMENNI